MRRLLLALPLLAGCPLEGPASATPASLGSAPGGAPAALDADDEACGLVQVLSCGDSVTLNTATDPRARSEFADYGDLVGRWSGPELGFRVRADAEEIELRLVDARPTELDQDILVLDRSASACDPAAFVGIGFNSIDVDGGDYTVFVDGYNGEQGEFTLAVDCTGEATGGVGDGPEDVDPGDDAGAPADDGGCTGVGRCVESFPFFDTDTTTGLPSQLDGYACAPGVDESGPERIYELVIDQPGYLAAWVDDGSGVDVDVHLLSSLDPADCEDRGDVEAWAHVQPGTWYLVVDSFGGAHNAGAYDLRVGHVPAVPGDCAMDSVFVEGLWGPGVQTPATGRVVMEAHLVTDIDGYGSSPTGPWPQTQTENLAVHYRNTAEVSGMVMDHTEPWAPHNGNNYGQGAHWSKLPELDEVWYVNMLWADRPAAGTRMILSANGRSIVAAAGYETGPGELDVIGGATEEIHRYLGTVHRSTMTMGFASDQTLPLGPIDCQ